ncbi:MAG: class I SAM-dependent methyltransferase [Deltaproteobacteria bacterium]|nr:class I SAM-dependent methyltransferase [Deltaproteobacteria bacterium]
MDQIEYWNGPAGDRWAREQAHIDAGMSAITELLFRFAAPRAGERVLDVGCGAGTTTLRLASLGCDVTGIDVSRPMLEVARRRGARVLEGDAAAAPGTYDLIFSRFGVMFFADPPAAFAHLRAITRRFAFVCWQPYEMNPWAHEPMRVAADLLPPQPPLVVDAPGPFGLARRERILEVLPGAEITAASSTMGIGSTLDEAVAEGLTIGPLARAAAGLDEPTRDRIRGRLRELYARYVTPEGVRFPAAIWLVRA